MGCGGSKDTGAPETAPVAPATALSVDQDPVGFFSEEGGDGAGARLDTEAPVAKGDCERCG
jgi:hypothetical protein